MNTKKTKQFVTDNRVITLRADKTHADQSGEANDLLVELGNFGKTIPFVAIYPPDGTKPIVLDGLISQSQLLDALNQATHGGDVASVVRD